MSRWARDLSFDMSLPLPQLPYFVYARSKGMQEVKALARLYVCEGPSEPWLLVCVINTKTLSADPYNFNTNSILIDIK